MAFFDRVLPVKGPFTVFAGSTGPDGKLAEQRHWNGLQSHEAVEKKIQELSTRPLNIFFAVGSYAGTNRGAPIAKRALFLDLDGKDFDSIQNALLGLSTFVRTVGLPPPSIYVHSGRGVHVYWCLDRDYPVAEWLPVAKALKAKCEELGFTADPTPTADPARVLRAPGTLNRKETNPIPCRILSDNGSSYSLAQIATQLGAGRAGVGSAASRLASLAPATALITKPTFKPLAADEVEAMLSCIELPPINNRDLWIQILCSVQDWSKKSPAGWKLFDAWSATQSGYNQQENRKTWDSFEPDGGITIATLVKMAVENGYEPPGTPTPVQPASLSELIAGPTADEPQEPRPQHYTVTDPLMIAAQHAVNSGGKTRFGRDEAVQFLANEFVIITEQKGIYYSVTKREMLPREVVDDLLTRYMPLNSTGVPTNASLIMRRYGVRHTVQAPGFHPTAPAIYAEHGKSYVNQYTAPAPLITPLPQEIALLDDFWAYMFPLPDDQQFSDYLKQCYGLLVQHPEIKIDSASLIIGAPGSGKTTLAYEIPRLLTGESNAQMVSNKTLRGAYSSYINGKKFLHFDEIHINGKWDSDDTVNALKSLVAGSTVEVHPKFMAPFNIPNRLFVSATSNYDDAMNLPNDGERRWAVYAHIPQRAWTASTTKEAYFKTLYQWLNSARGAGVLRAYFAAVNISAFNPAAPPPVTTAKKRMIRASQGTEVQCIAEAMEDEVAPFNCELLTNDRVKQFLHSETGKVYTSHQVREFLRRADPTIQIVKQIRPSPKQPGVYVLTWKNKVHWLHKDRSDDEIRKGLAGT